MFDTSPSRSGISNGGRQSFLAFNKAVILEQVERVRGDSEQQSFFRSMLLRFRNGEVTDEECERLAERRSILRSTEELALFKNAKRIVARHCDEIKINDEALQENPNPKLMVLGVHKPTAAKDSSADEAMGLEGAVMLAVGAKVMLKSNMWVDKWQHWNNNRLFIRPRSSIYPRFPPCSCMCTLPQVRRPSLEHVPS